MDYLPTLDLDKFFLACNPANWLDVSKPDDKHYYINFADVRGGDRIDQMIKIINRLPAPTCQLFTGHIGCGKSTELLRLKDELERQNFHVTYFEVTTELDVNDVDVSDVLLAIAHQVSVSVEAIGIKLRPNLLLRVLQDVVEVLKTPIDEINLGAEFSVGIGKFTAQMKQSPQQRNQLRLLLEPRTRNLLEAINSEIFNRTSEELRKRGKAGLVLIIDNLDRITDRPRFETRPQPEYLFIDRGLQLGQLNCHKVYTFPPKLMFSNDAAELQLRLGEGRPFQVLPMVPTRYRDGRKYSEGMKLLRQMIMARAFPDKSSEERLTLISKIFDSPETLDRLCEISGGHLRQLLKLLFRCLMQQEPPLLAGTLEQAIRDECGDYCRAIEDEEWQLLAQVHQRKQVSGIERYQILLKSLFVFEYRERQGTWFDINPILAEAEQFKQIMGGK
jgi:hypothetical protein